MDEARSEWQALDDKKLLSDLGYNNKNAKADEPAVLALVLRGGCNPLFSFHTIAFRGLRQCDNRPCFHASAVA